MVSSESIPTIQDLEAAEPLRANLITNEPYFTPDFMASVTDPTNVEVIQGLKAYLLNQVQTVRLNFAHTYVINLAGS